MIAGAKARDQSRDTFHRELKRSSPRHKCGGSHPFARENLSFPSLNTLRKLTFGN
jgi:hypothetical protein